LNKRIAERSHKEHHRDCIAIAKKIQQEIFTDYPETKIINQKNTKKIYKGLETQNTQ